jgi:hypothetical protein
MPEVNTKAQAKRLVKRFNEAKEASDEVKAKRLGRRIAAAVIDGRWPGLPARRSLQLPDGTTISLDGFDTLSLDGRIRSAFYRL